MTKYFYFLMIFLIPLFLYSQNSIKGNVFYKFNNFVGNRADAGSTVYLFCENNSKKYLETNCDLAGNFSFDNIDSGKYLVVVLSKNIKQFPEQHASEYKYINIIKYFGTEIPKSLLDSSEIYRKVYDSLDLNRPTKKKLLKSWEPQMNIARKNWIGSSNIIENYLENNSPFKKDLSFPLFNMGFKGIYLKEVESNTTNRNASIVVDFGLTAF